MADKYFADVSVQVRVFFEDDGVNDLNDQAIEAVDFELSLGELEDNGMSIIGKVEKLP